MSTVPQTVVDQQLQQIKNVQALAPISGPNVVGIDGSRTPPQVATLVNTLDGQLPRPATIGDDYYRKARQIRRDPTIRLARELSMAPLLMAEWEFDAKPNAPAGAKELVTEIMNDLRLPLMRSSMCGQIDYGWQPYEIIAEGRPDGATAPRLKPLLQDLTWILVNAADGSYFGLRQTPMFGTRIGWIYLLEDESFVISQDVEGTNWYGEPTLRSIEDVWDESQIIRKNSRKYDAKVAGTHWVIYYPLGTSNYGGVEMDNGALAKELLAQAESVGGIAVPRSVLQAVDAMNAAAAEKESTQWKIELLSDEGSGQTSFMDKLKYLDTLKVRAFGLPERSVLEGQFGTKAEAESHADIAVANMEVKHALLCVQYNAKLVDRVLSWNYGVDAKGTVRIKPSPLADDTLAFFKQIYLALLTNPQGFMTEVSTMDLQRLRDKLGVPGLHYDPMTQYNVDPYSEMGGGQGMGEADPLTAMLNYGGGQPAATGQGVGFSFDPEEARDESGKWTEGGGNSQTSSPAFKKWFSGSKVVSSNGNPLRVYHGTNKDFTKFENPFTDPSGQRGEVPGWNMFATNAEYANEFATDDKGANIKPVFLNVKNPLDLSALDAKGGDARPKILRIAERAGVDKKALDSILGYGSSVYQIIHTENKNRAGLVKVLSEAGIDGIAMPEHLRTRGNGEHASTTWITFDAKQIKSATGNRGTFDPSEADIRLSRESDAITAAARVTAKPSKQQAKAGNYRKGKANIHGLTISIENAKGSRRKPEWPKLPAHYGYINRTEGADDDHVDVFVGKHPDSEMVYVIDQCDKEGGFDEHKVMLGFKNQKKAVQAYRDSYNSGHRVGPVTAMTMGAFKRWLEGGG